MSILRFSRPCDPTGGAVADDESTPATRWWRSALARGKSMGVRAPCMQRIQLDDIVIDTLPQLLRMEDRSSMAFSLEARVPLLDHRLVQFGVSLPDHLKVNRGWSKFALRHAIGWPHSGARSDGARQSWDSPRQIGPG